MNQRSSHFTLGTSSVPYGSIYTKDYVQKQASRNQVPILNPFRGSSLQNPNQKSSFQTTNKTMLKDWGNVQTSKLDNKKLQSLKTHHFNLGNYNPINSHNTSHKIFYDRKVISNDANKNQQDSKIKMRMHHHDFKQQNYTNFQSSYNSQYIKPQGVVFDRSEIKKNQGGNAIILGNHRVPMLTSNAIDYTQKKPDSSLTNLKNPLQQGSSLILGTQPSSSPMQTINQLYYNPKPLTKNQLPQSTMKQLRSTHFNLGGMKQSYQTENQLYKSYTNNLNNKMQIPHQESGTWVDKNMKFNGKTTNQRELPERNGQPYKKYGSSIKNGFNLGSFKGQYQTQFNSNFTQKPTSHPSSIPTGKREDNILIGCDPTSYYESEQKSNYKQPTPSTTKNDFNHIKNINSEDHFKIGGEGSQYHITTYQDQYRKDVENKNKMFHKNINM